ncbi:MAG: DNA repair protein RecN (Recombination protein N), partial [Kiritimatiellia bacterium]
MLSCLRVHNLAIIEDLEVEFGPGLNVVTGETGAGKSILVASLQLVLGARARPEMVRSGCEQAEIQALFEPADPDIQARVRGMDLGDGSEILIRRIIKASGRSKVYINGRLCTLSELRGLCVELVDISSQHEHTTLVQPSTHLHFLDAFGGHGALRVRVAQAWSGLREAQLAVQELERRFRNRVQHEDLLRLHIDELELAKPQEGELDELSKELSRLRHAGGLLEAAAGAGELLDGDDGICHLVGLASTAIARASAHDPALAEMEQRLDSARTELQDIAYDLAAYTRAINADPARAHRLEERVTTLRRLVRKHGTDEAGLVALHKRAVLEIDGFADLEQSLDEASDGVA